MTTESATAYLFVLPIAIRLRSNGHSIEFACAEVDSIEAPSRLSEIRAEGFKTHRIDFSRHVSPLQNLKAFYQLRCLLRKSEFDVVHTHNSVAGFVGRFAARPKRNVVHTVYDFEFRAHNRGLKRKFFIFLERVASRYCRHVFFITEGVRNDAVIARIKSDEATSVVGLGVEVDKVLSYRIEAEQFRQRYNLPSHDLLIGCVGRLISHKGMDVLIRAFAVTLQARPNVYLVIAGDGSLRAELTELSQSLGIGERVRFVGYLQRKEVLELMSSIDIFALATRREGLGVVYLEAMTFGKPVLGTDITPVNEVIQDGFTGLLGRLNCWEDFSDRLKRLIDDPALRTRLGSAAANLVADRYDTSHVAYRIEKCYRTLVGEEV